jgi:multicomponent Na+:H+ antiporter subunit C
MTTAMLYSLAGIALFGIGLHRLVTTTEMIRRVVAVNVMGSGAASVLVAAAYRGPDVAADPVPHAFVLTGIVVALSTTAFALALIRRLHEAGHNEEEEEG